MKKQLIPIVGVAGLALTGLSAHAQVFNYTDGDILLDFSQSGGTHDVEVDLGSLASLDSQSGGSTVQLANFSSQLTTAGLNVSSLAFSVFGINNSVGTLWLSQTQPGANPITAPNDLSATSQAAVQSKVLGILGSDGFGGFNVNGILPWSAAPANAGPNNTATTAIIPTSSHSSYTYLAGAGWSGAPSNPKNTTPASFTSGSITSDLFQFDPTGNTAQPSGYEGYFTFNSNGALDFTSVAVPEPGTYGLVGAGGLLALTLRNQLRRKQV